MMFEAEDDGETAKDSSYSSIGLAPIIGYNIKAGNVSIIPNISFSYGIIHFGDAYDSWQDAISSADSDSFTNTYLKIGLHVMYNF